MHTPEPRTFGEYLRQQRIIAGWSQEALAEAAGLSVRGISDLERGLRLAPHPTTLDRLAQALDVPLGDLKDAARQARRRAPVQSRHNLPHELSSFVGRHDELHQLADALATSRLLTLAGPGGIGKTRLALRIAAASDYPAGTWLVELASLADPDLVAQRVADVLAPGEPHGLPAMERLLARLRDQRLLLVLDNCEHVLLACIDLVATLLRACAGLTILATSREPLGITGEVTWRVPPLSTTDAVTLLVERVTALQPRFSVDASNAAAIAETCRRLDGIPLALELAAAHVPTLGIDGVVQRLDDRLRLLVGGDRAAPSRHQTLRATIDWSYALLEDRERKLLDDLSVFAGGSSLEGVEAVCGIHTVVGSLERLIAKSLVIAEPRQVGGGLRYYLLETVRAYAAEHLADGAPAPGTRRAHATYFALLAERAEPQLSRADQVRWLDLLEQEHDNLRAALAWALDHDVELGLRLAAALARFWFIRGHVHEGSTWLDRLLASAHAGHPRLARANALTAAGILAWHRTESDQAERHLRASLALRDETADDPHFSRTLYELAKVLSQRGDRAGARACGERALERWRRSGDGWGMAVALNFIGEVLREERNLADAAACYAESRDLFEQAGDVRGLAIATQNLGNVATEQGDFARALSLHRSTLPLKLDLGDREGLSASLVDVGYLVLQAGRAPLATRLCAVAEVARESVGAVLPDYEHDLAEQAIEQARAALGTALFEEHWRAGQQLPLDDAVAEALAR